jgi:CTP synthase
MILISCPFALQIACRLLISKPVEPATKEKISMFCHVAADQVVGVHDLVSVYHVPLLLKSQGIIEFFQRRLKLEWIGITAAMSERGLSLEKKWREVTAVERFYETVTIVLVGKYTDFADSYMSVTKALEHAAFRCQRKLTLQVCSLFCFVVNSVRNLLLNYAVDRINKP